jgi:hypothetical protein
MKLLLATVAATVATAALAQSSDTCKLVDEGKGTKIWQCAPTPIAPVPNTAPASGQQSNTVPADDKK